MNELARGDAVIGIMQLRSDAVTRDVDRQREGVDEEGDDRHIAEQLQHLLSGHDCHTMPPNDDTLRTGPDHHTHDRGLFVKSRYPTSRRMAAYRASARTSVHNTSGPMPFRKVPRTMLV